MKHYIPSFLLAFLACILCGCRAQSEHPSVSFPREAGQSYLLATVKANLDTEDISITTPTTSPGQSTTQTETLEDGFFVTAYYIQSDGRYALVTPLTSPSQQELSGTETLPDFPDLFFEFSDMDGLIYAGRVTDGTRGFDVRFCADVELEADRVVLFPESSLPDGLPREEFIARLTALGLSEFFEIS